MGEIIRDWLRTRLGILIDLSPEIFGHYARDGTLLAKVLHSYDVINDSQLNTLVVTQDPALARVNLKHLRLWLRFVGVECDAECIEDISNGKGTMALRLFYKVFLCLENKDRLHFITLQKEREKYIPSSSKFDVTRVSEEPEIEELQDHPFAEPLRKNRSLIDWQRKRNQRWIGAQIMEPEGVSPTQEKIETVGKSSYGKKKSQSKKSPADKSLANVSAMRELDEFAKKHRVKKSEEASDPCEDSSRHSLRVSKAPKIDHEAAKAFTKSLKSKRRQDALTKSFKTRMQKNLLSELWQKVLDDQEMEFDEIVAKKVLHQSEYEKQLVRKMCEVRSQKTRMAGNRAIVEELLEKTRESELRLDQERAREVMVRESEEVEAERRRIDELERRIEEQSRQRRMGKIRRFGEEIVRDIVDISVKAGDYKIESNEERIPKSLWNEWKTLFIKSQPIIPAEDEMISGDNVQENESHEFTEEEDAERTRVLNDEDFENYQNTRVPWKDFMPNVDDEVDEYLKLGLVVLGYIVHKTMESLHPSNEMDSVESPLPAFKIRAVLLGIPDSLLDEPIQDLLKNRKIRLIRIEEAINHCLGQYKSEMKDFEYIELDNITVSRDEPASPSDPSEATERGTKIPKTKRSSSSKPKTATSLKKPEMPNNVVDKVTQTPRVIPHEDMDPSLSDSAYIGKWIHEFFTLGEPLSDELVSRIIVVYLRNLEDIDGFVLVNYPNTYRQMYSLESALCGRKFPVANDELLGNADTNIEEIEKIPSRIVFDEGESNFSAGWKQSRLVPNPLKQEYSHGNSYFTTFVRIKPKPGKLEREDDDDIWEVLSEDATSVDAFYVDQEIASIIYYAIFDLRTLKKLVRLVIAGKNELIARASSQELFGDYLRYFDGRGDDDYSASKAPVVKKLLRSRASDLSLGESKFSESIESGRGYDVENLVSRSRDGPALPGEREWSWANLPQTFQLVQSLADLWKNIETSYVENLKEIFHMKRTNFEAIVPYRDFVARHMRETINRPDQKQDLLHEFHRAFNDIDEEIRDDVEVKRELHCRIDDLQIKLWETCDSRRRDSENERKRIIEDHWTSLEVINIANIYIDILQIEIDRCNDTLQFIQDYYTSMLQRTFQEIRSSVSLKKIILPTSGSRLNISSGGNGSAKGVKEKESKEAKVKTSSSKILQAPSAPSENYFQDEIAKLLIEADQDNFSAAQTLGYKSIENNTKYIESILETLASRLLDNLKKEETIAAKSPIETRDKKASSRKISRSSKAEHDIEKKRIRDLILEWRFAVMFEVNRIRVRLKILDAAARSDLNYLIGTMIRLFSGIQKNITDRYNREVKSVNEMASTFRFAVEEGKAIQEEMLLDADRFLVRSNVLMFPEKLESPRLKIPEEILPARFTVSQLTRLVDLFRRSAPAGILSERSFVYILQDLIVCDDSGGGNSLLPSSWFEMRACDVTRLVYELFGDDEFVDWREFIIYAMDIAMPSLDEIIDDLNAFKEIDDKSEESVDCAEFFATRLWFFDGNVSGNDSSKFDLQEIFPRTEEIIHEKSSWGSLKKMTDISGYKDNDAKSGETLRLALMKKLLCKIFSSDCRRVNYVALLLAFCKDDAAEIGLAKALSIALGNKICISWEDGEKYVREGIENKRRAHGEMSNEENLRKEAEKASEAIVERLMKRIFESIAPKIGETKNNETSSVHDEKSDRSEELMNSLQTGDEKSSAVPSESRTEKLERRKSRGLSVTISLPEANETSGRSRTKDSSMIYWINFEVAQSVLAAVLPIHAMQPDLLGSGKSLRENLELVYFELRQEEIMDGDSESILAHRFIHHDFIKKLLADTSKFTTKYLGNIVDTIVQENQRFSVS